MTVLERVGDLFAAQEPALAHGCNCSGVMAKGIAVGFRKRWPDMYRSYRERCLAGEFKPGDVFTWREGDRVVFNLGTQGSWRTKATPDAIRRAVEGMVVDAKRLGIERIAMPRIGSGLGGMEWG
jgi:O-acetyl-ADP-ribose deacetylase (regulator of RNase III)